MVTVPCDKRQDGFLGTFLTQDQTLGKKTLKEQEIYFGSRLEGI